MSKADALRLPDYLRHILEAVERVERYTEDLDEVGFLNDEKTQDAVIRNFEIIGEASNNVKRYHPDFSNSYPEIPLGFAYEMRNALSHGYFKVDLDIVWQTIHNDLPELYRLVSLALEEIKTR